MDAVGTILRPRPSVAAAYASVGRAYGIDLNEEAVGTRFREALTRYNVEAFQKGQAATDPLRTDESIELLRWQAIVNFVLSPPPSAEAAVFETLWNHFGEPDHWQLFPDVLPAMAKLAEAGFRLGIASNFDHRLRPIVQNYLSDFPLSLHISSEIGWVKPAEQYYRAVEMTLNVPSGEILLIGDDWGNDVAAPRQLGWQTIYLNRDGKPGDQEKWGAHESLVTVADQLCSD